MSRFARSRTLSRRARESSYYTKLRHESLEDRSLMTLLGAQLFPADNPWNQRIAEAPVAATSAAIINNIVTRFGNGRLHPDFGQDSNTSDDLYGIPYNVVHGYNTPKISVVIDAYPDESDLLSAPIPANPVLEGDYQNGPKVGVDNRGDSHLLVYDVDNKIVYEYYRASRPSENTDHQWHADQETVWDLKTNTFRTLGHTSADAAGLPILTGLVRPDEALPTSQGGQGVINHAIRMTLQNSIILDQFLFPASHVANSGNENTAIQPPMGARFRLKASVDISQLNPQAKIIAQAMKDYGLIVADNGSNFYFSGASRAVDANNQETLTFNDNDIQDSTRGLKSLHFSDFEVVDLTPIVLSLSATSGAAGATVTITGQNFSGAAGKLRVTFGNAVGTSVTILDDKHLTVVVPAGSGTVDVRVQSGATVAANIDNYKNTVFGYGISAVTSADRFTYGAATLTGDVNGDHIVNQSDLNVAFANWLSTGATRAQGDANGDGAINQLDINTITANWLATGTAAASVDAVAPITSTTASYKAATAGRAGVGTRIAIPGIETNEQLLSPQLIRRLGQSANGDLSRSVLLLLRSPSQRTPTAK